MEKRANSRVVFHIRARLDCDGRMIEGQVHDLSLRGMFLAAEERFTEGELVEAAVDLTGDSSQLTMTLRGVVTRVETGGSASSSRTWMWTRSSTCETSSATTTATRRRSWRSSPQRPKSPEPGDLPARCPTRAGGPAGRSLWELSKKGLDTPRRRGEDCVIRRTDGRTVGVFPVPSARPGWRPGMFAELIGQCPVFASVVIVVDSLRSVFCMCLHVFRKSESPSCRKEP